MSNTDWDTKTVIGFKAKAPKVTRNTSDLNGELFCVSAYADLADQHLSQLYVMNSSCWT